MTTFATYQHRRFHYAIKHPEDWQIVEHEDGAVEFWHPDRDQAAIGLTIFQPPQDIVVQLSQSPGEWERIAREFLLRANSQKIGPDESLPYRNLSASREEANQSGRRWVIQSADRTLCVATNLPITERENKNPILISMLSSFEIFDLRSLDQELLNALTEMLQAKLPDASVEVTASAIRIDSLSLPTGEVLSALRSCLDTANPNRREALTSAVEQFADSLLSAQQSGATIGSERWSHSCHRVLPLLKSTNYVIEVNQRNTAAASSGGQPPSILVSLPWLQGLRVCFGIDDKKTFRFISDSDLHRWNITLEELCQTALQNLKAIPFPEILVRAPGEGQPKIAVLEPTIGAASSYLLHPDLYRTAVSQLGAGIIVGIPSRDVCIFFEDGVDLSFAKHVVAMEFNQTDHRLSTQLFRLTANGIAPLS